MLVAEISSLPIIVPGGQEGWVRSRMPAKDGGVSHHAQSAGAIARPRRRMGGGASPLWSQFPHLFIRMMTAFIVRREASAMALTATSAEVTMFLLS